MKIGGAAPSFTPDGREYHRTIKDRERSTTPTRRRDRIGTDGLEGEPFHGRGCLRERGTALFPHGRAGEGFPSRKASIPVDPVKRATRIVKAASS